MMNTDQVRQNVDAARKFEPMTSGRRSSSSATPSWPPGRRCAPTCDGSCGRAGGTKARLGDLARLLTYHEHHGARVMAREEICRIVRRRTRLARRRPRSRPRGLPQPPRFRQALAPGGQVPGVSDTQCCEEDATRSFSLCSPGESRPDFDEHATVARERDSYAAHPAPYVVAECRPSGRDAPPGHAQHAVRGDGLSHPSWVSSRC